MSKYNKEQSKKWRENNPEKVTAWRKTHHIKALKQGKVYRERTKEERRDYQLKTLYNISLADYNAMFVAQNGVCKICNKPETVLDRRTKQPVSLSVDHDHSVVGIIKVRGLLCKRCNRSIGQMEDSIELLQNAIKYLKNGT